MPPPSSPRLSRRKREILDVLYRLGEASVADVLPHLHDGPDYHAVRVTLARMEREGWVRHREDGPRYVYAPTIPREQARRTAVRHLMQTFFGGSPSRAILTILDEASLQLSSEELDEIARRIDEAGQTER